MQALSSATGLATERKPSLVTAVRSMIKELVEELLIIFLKFKAWLTPGTADDKVRASSFSVHQSWECYHACRTCSRAVGVATTQGKAAAMAGQPGRWGKPAVVDMGLLMATKPSR
jgi:hypothetical protein